MHSLNQSNNPSAAYYSYGTPSAKAANTADKIELQSQRSMDVFYYDNGQELAIFHILGSPTDTLQERYTFNFSAPSLAGKGVEVTLRDDPNDRTVTWDSAKGPTTANIIAILTITTTSTLKTTSPCLPFF